MLPKKPTAFCITKDANISAEEIIKAPGNCSSVSEMCILGISITIASKDSSHQSIEWNKIKQPGGIMKGRLNDYENHEVLAHLYLSVFNESEKNDVWKNLQKAASHGIMILKSEYVTSQNLLDWEKISKDFS